jgi:hypothetical protein
MTIIFCSSNCNFLEIIAIIVFSLYVKAGQVMSIWCMIFLKFPAFSYAIVSMHLFSVLQIVEWIGHFGPFR